MFRGTVLPVETCRLGEPARKLFTTELSVPILATPELYRNPTGLDRCRLNRLLLEDSFPGLISRDHAFGYQIWNRMMDSLRLSAPMSEVGSSGTDVLGDYAKALSHSFEMLLRGAMRTGSSKTYAVGRVLALQLHETATQFGLVPHIEGHAREQEMRRRGYVPFLTPEEIKADPEMGWLELESTPKAARNPAPNRS